MPFHQTLKEMGHHQPKTIVTTDNPTARGLIANTMIPKTSQAMDMQLNWLKCCLAQQQINFQWKQVSANLVDYHIKHQPIEHHREICSTYVLDHTDAS